MVNNMITKILLLMFCFISISTFQSNIFSQGLLHTQCRNGLNIPILDYSTTVDSMLINLPSDSRVLDVNLLLDTILHTWVSDLRIYLRKGIIGVKVINNVGGSGDNFIGILLDDSAGVILPGPPPLPGRYKPYDSLSRFNNQLAAGYWKLVITDTAAGDTGFLKAWCLHITHSNVSGGIQTVEIPNTYRLYQNYPNPFNPVTKIKYGMPKNGYIMLTIYDGLGKEVAVADEGFKYANTYEAVFDATNLPSGVYYYKLEAGVFSDTKKMVIVK